MRNLRHYGTAALTLAVLGSTTAERASAAENDLTFVNTTPQSAAALTAAAREAGMTAVVAAKPDMATFAQGIVVWEAHAGDGGDINDARAARLREYVRRGGNLLITLSPDSGNGPFRLADMLPTTAWKTRLRDREEDEGPLTMAETDSDLFGSAKIAGFTVPFWHEIRPVSAAERGEARYDRYERPIPYLATTKGGAPTQPAGTEFWTRSLLSREWRIRARGAGVGAAPLLLTGKYGAGHVAVFASTAEIPDSATTRAFWTPVLKWLDESRPIATSSGVPAQLAAPTVQVDVAKRSLLVTLSNPTASPLPIHLLGRILTWEHAYVADSVVDAVLPASGSTTVTLPIAPPPGATSYQALYYRDAYNVRLGVLSDDGASLLSESKANADLTPAVSIALASDPSQARDYPFHAPPPYANGAMGFHPLGLPLSSYGYKPGSTANIAVTLANGGLRNLAPLAIPADVADPSNHSAIALNDGGSMSEKGPMPSEVSGWGAWQGAANRENIVSLTFPHPVNVTAVTLVGAGVDERNDLRHNPTSVIVEADGHEVVAATKIGARFTAEGGRVTLNLAAPTSATVIRLHFPASPEAPILGEVEVNGWDAATGSTPAPTVSGTLTVSMEDALTGRKTPLSKNPISLVAGVPQTVSVPISLPAGSNADFFRVTADFASDSGSVASISEPILTLEPKAPITPLGELHGGKTLAVGFIVTRGFRNLFDTGTGTAEIHPGWGQPDDLVWGFARGLKQLHSGDRALAGRLYVSESDFRHYSTPWRTFPGGEDVFDVGAPQLVDRFRADKGWAEAKAIHLGFSDRWDTGPEMDAVYSWQDFESFNAYLKTNNQPGLTGRTREELSTEIRSKYSHQWSAFHLEQYVHDLRAMREAVTKAGKTLDISAQGYPLVPPAEQKEVAGIIRGMSDDSTWGMVRDSIPHTTGRQMAVLAFSPGLQISTLSQWGYESALLENPMWHNAVGTTEPSRRHQYDRAFRAVLRPDGAYTTEYAYGYNTNAGYAYTFNANDYAEWMRVQEKESLLTPEAPIGAGLVIASGYLDDPHQTDFAAGGNTFAMPVVKAAAHVVERLHEAGVSISFVASASTFDKWPASNPPMILVDPEHLTPVETVALHQLIARGVHVAVFAAGSANALSAGVLTLPLNPGKFTPDEAAAWAPKITAAFGQQITFPSGTAGYGFRSAGRSFVVVEDWREEARTVALRYRPAPGVAALRAADADTHRPLSVRKEGEDYVIDVPMRPGDGVLVAIKEDK